MKYKQSALPFAFFEGKIIPLEKASVNIMTNALQYGTGVFGGIRGYYNKEKGFINIFRLHDHYTRLFASLRILGVTIPYAKEELIAMSIKLLKKNKPVSDTYMRPIAYAASYDLSPNLASVIFEFALYMIPLGDYLPTNTGLSVMVSSWRRISDGAIPSRAKATGGYINSSLARKEAADNGFDEAIVLTDEGHVAEGSAENLFLVRDGVLVTPSQTDNILEGITRKTVLQLAKDLGIPTEVRSIDRTELYVADEAFFSGTGVQVAWISNIDKRAVGSGKRGAVTQKLQDAFFEIVRGNNKTYEAWNTKVSINK